MARQEKYTQCRLRRPLRADRKREPDAWLERSVLPDEGDTVCEVMVSWIKAEIAQKGKTVRLKGFGRDDWSEGWIVIDVGSTQDGDRVEAAVPDHRHQREMSDV